MGFFDSIFKPTQAAAVTPPTFPNNCSAVMAILYSAISADGVIDELEIDAMVKIIVLKKSFEGYDTISYYKNAMKLASQFGNAYLIKAASDALDEEHRKVAFILTVELMMSNGTLNTDEQTFVNDLSTVLQLDEIWVNTLSEIVSLKYS